MLTNPTRYGLIACRYLAWGWHYGVWLNAPEIADRYRINVRALSPALLRLVQAGSCTHVSEGRSRDICSHATPPKYRCWKWYAHWKEPSAWTAAARYSRTSSVSAKRTTVGYAECSVAYWTSCVTGFPVCRLKTMPQLKNFYQLTGGKTLQTNKIEYLV